MSGNPPFSFLEFIPRDEGSWHGGPPEAEHGGSLSRSGRPIPGVEI